MEYKISIVTDSGTDLLPDEAAALGVIVLPVTVRYDDKEYLDGETITRDEFYAQLRPDHLPKTSLVSPQTFEACFEKEIEKGNEVICLTMSSDISGTCQSAFIASQKFNGKVKVIDTRHFCGSEQILVRRAATLREQGLSMDEIVFVIEKEKNEVVIVALFDTLEYVKAGGRISGAKAAIGMLLGIKPVITIRDGKVAVVGKARGSKNGNNFLMKMVKDNGGIDWDRPILLSWTGNDDTLLNRYIKDSAVLYEGRKASDLPLSRVGATIGTYAGPGAIAFAFFPKKNK